jgi:hypothetical protein
VVANNNETPVELVVSAQFSWGRVRPGVDTTE